MFRNRLSRLALAALACLVLAAAVASPAHATPLLRVYYPDIEQGSATLVVGPTGQALLIDAGSELASADDDVVVFLEELVELGVVTSLDAVLASHYDEDHIGHMEDVLSHGLLSPTGVVYDRGTFLQTPTSFAYSDYEYAAGAYTRTTVAPGDVISLGGGVTATVKVVNGQVSGGSIDISTSNQFENAASVGVLIEYGDFDLWIAGDLTGNFTEYGVADVEALVAPLIGDVEVYTVHHHGSRTSSTVGFLSAIEAEVAINQNSADNGFGHPNSIVVNQFLATPDSCGATPLWVQQNPGNPGDSRSDDTLADGIADPDDVDGVVGLAGTVLLVSDGTHYQISGGDVAPISRHTNCALPSSADFPPAILEVGRGPWVPTAAQATTVEADVRDEAVPTVSLHWSVDGVAQTPLAMAPVAGTNLWRATIPAQVDGARVAYAVHAVDGAAQSATSAPDGYYSGTTPIATLRWNDPDGILIPTEYAARVEADVTVEPGVYHGFVSQIFVEDASGAGLQIFDRSLLAIARGDRVEFVGELEQFGGQTELNIAQNFGGYGHTVVSAGTAPAPVTITVAQVGEAWEGRLVRLDNLTVISGTIPGPGGGNGYLTVSDDGGVTTTTLKIDADTDIPGAATPTQPFDVIGVLSQFDAWPPLDGGYQIVPRGKADVLSPEVNVPAMIVHEIHADPHPSEGDANGDGLVSIYDDEFVELVNTTWADLDLSGWSLEDGVSTRHVFPVGTVVPAREAVVVFAGGSPTGAFGNAGANGLVFTASSGSLGLNNSGDTVTLRDDLGAVVQAVSYGSAGGDDQSLTRSPAWSNSPLVRHTTVGSGRFSPGGWAEDGGAFTIPPGAVVISEVLYDATGSDGGLEWIEIVNLSGAAIDLSKRPVSLAWGGSDWTHGGLTLDSGTLPSCAPFVIGGPDSTGDNANPVYDLVADFSPDLQNSGADADGVALFNRPHSFVDAATVPADAVRYGTSNGNCLIDAAGACSAPDVGDAGSGQSIERTGATGPWQIQTSPTPGSLAWTPSCGSGGGGGPGGGGGTCLDASTLAAGDLVLSEVFYDASGGDDGLEWVELYNASSQCVDLAGLSLGWGGSDYTYGGEDLSGQVAAGATFVVGGTTASSANANPSFDLPVNVSPDLQNSGSDADGVALFLVQKSAVTSSTVPYDAVIYGGSNTSCLLDAAGTCASPHVGDAGASETIERTSLAGAWTIQATPTPNATPLP